MSVRYTVGKFPYGAVDSDVLDAIWDQYKIDFTRVTGWICPDPRCGWPNYMGCTFCMWSFRNKCEHEVEYFRFMQLDQNSSRPCAPNT